MKYIIQTKFLRDTLQVSTWLIQESFPGLGGQVRNLERLITTLDLSYRRNPLATVKWMKDLRMAFYAYLSGRPIKVKGVRSLSPSGLPKALAFLREVPVNSEAYYWLIRIINTILCSSRSLNLGKDADVSSISDPRTESTDIDRVILKHVPLFWKTLGFRPEPRKTVPAYLTWSRFHLTTKAGPASCKDSPGNALWHSMSDLRLLKQDENQDLLESIKVLGGPKLRSRLDLLSDNFDYLSGMLSDLILMSMSSNLRRLVSFPDKELKVRVVALLDYWSQTSLRQLHSWIFKILRRIPQDQTFDQGAFTKILLEQNGTNKFHSIDLSSATDRFPISIIKGVLEGRLPSSYVNAWESVMISKPFDYKGSWISYAVGNPMGAYSSWASFSLAHHYLIFYCFIETKKSGHFFDLKYCLLGDDIVIYDDEVGAKYLEVIRSLGVGVSDPKTHISSTFFEFAKRLFLDGREISPFPISAMKESTKKFYLFVELLMQQVERGWIFSSGIPGAIGLYFGKVKRMPKRFIKSIALKSSIYEKLRNVISGTLPAGECLTDISQGLGVPVVPPISDEEGNSLLQNIAVELFTDSNPASNIKSKRPSIGLGNLAINLVSRLTDETKINPEIGFEVIQALPILGAYSSIEEKFVTLGNKASTYSEWPILLKTMGIPWDDQVFYARSSTLVSKVTSQMSVYLADRFKVLNAYPSLRAGFPLFYGATIIVKWFAKILLGKPLFWAVAKMWLIPSIRVIIGLLILLSLISGYAVHYLIGSIPIDLLFPVSTQCDTVPLINLSPFIGTGLILGGFLYDPSLYSMSIEGFSFFSHLFNEIDIGGIIIRSVLEYYLPYVELNF